MIRGYPSLRRDAGGMVWLAVPLLALSLLTTSGCNKGSGRTSSAAASTVTSVAGPAAGDSGSTAATETRPSNGDIGIAECDEYLKKMDACLAKMSPEGRSANQIVLQQSREAWKQASGNEGSRTDLKQGCQAALDAFAQNPVCK